MISNLVQVAAWGSVHMQADRWQFWVETDLVDLAVLSQLIMLSTDGLLLLLVLADPPLVFTNPPPRKRSSTVGRGVEGAGGTTVGVEGLLDLDLCKSL